MKKTGRNARCSCGSGKKYKRCCLNNPPKPRAPTSAIGPVKKIMDVGTSNPIVARLCLGTFDILDFTDLSKNKIDRLKEKILEMGQILVGAENLSKPILTEVSDIVETLSKSGVPIDENGKPYIPGKCTHLQQVIPFLGMMGRVLDEFLKTVNIIWETTFNKEQIHEIVSYSVTKFGSEHVVTKLLETDVPWIRELNALVQKAARPDFIKTVLDFHVRSGPEGKYQVTLPTFSDQQQIANACETYLHNVFTLIEEIVSFALGEFLDSRLTIREIPDQLRRKEAPVRFRVGVKDGVDVNTFKDDQRFAKIHRAGGQMFHLRQHLRENRFGKVRPIIHSEYRGKKTIVVGSRIYFGKWVMFSDFLMDYIKDKFGKEWWFLELAKEKNKRSLVLQWAKKTQEHQEINGIKRGEIFSINPNGPMHAYSCLAYDLFVLEDNERLQELMIERLKNDNKRTFWGARYEMTVAATFIRAGFDIEYEDETNNRSKHPEFIAVHRQTGERIAVEAKKLNRGTVPKNDEEVRVGVVDRFSDAIKKFNGLPLIIFIELDLPPIEGDPMQKPWIKELMESHETAGVRGSDGKDFCNMTVFTNYPTEHPTDPTKCPLQSYIISQSTVPKVPLKESFHLREIWSAIEKHNQIPSWFDE